MELLNSKNSPLWINFAVFAISAGVVRIAGTRISRYADQYCGDPVLNEVDSFSLFASLLGILVTTFYLIGLIERGATGPLRAWASIHSPSWWCISAVFSCGLFLRSFPVVSAEVSKGDEQFHD